MRLPSKISNLAISSATPNIHLIVHTSPAFVSAKDVYKRQILRGEKSPKRDAVLMNAGASLYIGGKAQTMAEGIELAAGPVSYTHLLQRGGPQQNPYGSHPQHTACG